jgi:protein-tyrosine phosphatase
MLPFSKAMVDLHHHLLPGLDDGPKDLETSIAMARMAAEDGITHVVATPHASNRFSFDPAAIAERAAALRQALAAESIPLTVATGCDFHISYDNVQDAIQHPRKYTLNQTDYLLVELHDQIIPQQVGETFYELRLAGMVPILTHPERNPVLQKNSARLADWLREGMLVQVTAGSVLGLMGEAAQKMAHTLLTNRWVHFLATDAHNLERRSPRMNEARETVARRYGADYANLLCVTNPTAVYNGQLLPEQEEPLHLYDDDYLGAPWWKRLFKGRG